MLDQLEELGTIQKYISTLFDSFPQAQIEVYQPDEETMKNLILQNIEYGRKIIELSDKFTAKYRKDHFTDRKDIEDKINEIFKIVCPHVYLSSPDEMVNYILKTLREDQSVSNGGASRGSYGKQNSRAASLNPLQNQTIKQSKMEYYRDEAELVELPEYSNQERQKILSKSKISCENNLSHDGLRRRKASNNNTKSKASKKGGQDFSAKKVLQIKNVFEDEEECIRETLEKINRIVNSYHVQSLENRPSISITKKVNDFETDNMQDFIAANVENNCENIKKVGQLVDFLDQYFEKKMKMEGYAQGKFSIYVEEINKRQQVYSFAVSKMIQGLTELRNNVAQKGSSVDALNIIDSLQEIGNQFYQLYPSHKLLKDLKVDKLAKEMEQNGLKNQGVQVSIGKTQKTIHRQMAESKRNLLQLYKVSTRVNEIIEKFERTTKFKKQIEYKQVQKFTESIRDSFPKKNSTHIPTSVASEVISYQEELKKLIDQYEKNEKEMNEEFAKKSKKQQKRIGELEKAISEIVEELRREQDGRENDKKKWHKKHETEKQENKRLFNINKQSELSIKQMGTQIKKLQKDIKQQYQKFDEVERKLVNENLHMAERAEKNAQTIEELSKKLEQEGKKYDEERQIYHQKIIMLQTQQESRNEEMAEIKFELEEMIKQNSEVRREMIELTGVYEENVKEQEELIENLKELQKQVKKKKLRVQELEESLAIKQQILKISEAEKQKKIQQSLQLTKELEVKEAEVLKFKEMGSLNESDINVLKEEMDKVKQAYLQAEEQLEGLRNYIGQIQIEKQYLIRENRNAKREIDDINERWETCQMNKNRMEKESKEYQDETNMKKKELAHLQQENDDLKRQIAKNKKQLQQLREGAIKTDSQIRQLRQQMHKKNETQSLESGKRKLELEATKVELRRKTEQFEKLKESYDEKLQILETKNKELSQFITQKQLLARITNNHQSQ